VLGVGLGVALITLGLIGSDPVEANRIRVPVEIEISRAPIGPTLSGSTDAADPSPLGSDRVMEVVVRRGDNLSLIFERSGLRRADLQRVLDADAKDHTLRSIFPGQTLSFRTDDAGTLLELRYVRSPLESIVYSGGESGFRRERELRSAEVRQAFRHATVRSSLFEAGLDSGISTKVILELATVLGGVIDFALDPRVGDTFSVLYEEKYLDGEKIGEGVILAAEYVNAGRHHAAFRYVDAQGDTGYFSPDGVSMRKAFLRAPLDFTRVSSNFNMRRLHPVAKVVRPHRGVDYAASTGTPVYASGDGRVIASAYSRNNGNYIFVEHPGKIVTRYLHLHKRLVKTGTRVKQGQTIGTVGSTGLATGPHLHYEFLVNGVHRNPRTVLDNLPRARSLDAAELAQFRSRISGVQTRLASYTKAWELALSSTTTD